MIKRGRVYYARFWKDGRLIQKRLARDLGVACEALNDLRARADRADFGLVDNDYKWSDLKKEFLRWAQQSIRKPKQYADHLGSFERYLVVQNVRQIDHAYIFGFREWRLQQPIYPAALPAAKRKDYVPKYPAARTVNMEVATLRAMLNKGVEWKRIGSNPIAGIKPLPDDSPRKQRRALTLEEVAALFKAAPSWFIPMLRLFATTGVRHDELVKLLFSDIDFDGRTLTVRAAVAKNGKAREIPLDDSAYDLLADLQRESKSRAPIPGKTPLSKFSASHVFVTKLNTPRKNNLLRAFYVVCKRAGIEDGRPGGSVDLHSLRVTFTTLALENGASPKAVQSILGHSTLALTMAVYAKATEKAKREAIAVLPFAKVQKPSHILAIEEQKAPKSYTA